MDDDTIYRQAAIDALIQLSGQRDEWDSKEGFAQKRGIDAAICAIEDLPSAERRGRWEALDRDCRGYAITYECSSCKQLITLPYPMKWMDYDYCPNCGAKMEEGGNIYE